MKNKSSILFTAVAAATACLAQLAAAYEPGDILVRAGAANVAPSENSSGIAVPPIDVPPIAGTGLGVDENTQLGLTATWMLSDTWGVELLAATPFQHDITANLGGLGTVAAGETKHLPPTLSVVWYPLGSAESIKPYVGAGVNYTVFFEEDVASELEQGLPTVVEALGGPRLTGPVPMELELDDSWGLAAQVGVDYALTERWHLNASVRWIDIDTEAEITSALGTTITVDDLEIDPWVYQLNIGYRF